MKNQISILLHIACLAILTRAQATETKTPIETCNVPYLTMSAGEIKATLTAVFQGKVDRGIQGANIIIEKYIPLIEHDVQFVRVSQIHFYHSFHDFTCAPLHSKTSGSYFLTKQLLTNLQHIPSGL
jgi:ATP phosphoribosyltransferase